MKTKIFLLTVISPLLCAQISFAETTKTRDLWFLPQQGQFQSTTELGYQNTETEIVFAGTPKINESEFVIAESLNYAITNEFHIAAGVAYSSQDNESLTSTTTKSSKSTSGIKDPAIGALYRILKQDASGLFLDASIFVSPSLGKAKASNVLRGSTLVSAGISLGQNNGNFEYAIVPNLKYYTDEKYEADSIKARFDFGLGVATQYDFNDTVSINAGLDLNLPGKQKEKTSGDEQKFDYALGLNVGPSFQILENLSAKVDLSYAYTTGDYTSGSTVDLKRRALGISGSLDFLF